MGDLFKCEYLSEEFKQYFLSYVEYARVSKNTIREYAGYIRLICNELHCDFLEISEEMAERYMRKLRDKAARGCLSVQTIRVRFACYSALAAYFHKTLGIFDKNPFFRIEKPECQDAPYAHRIPGVEECNKLLETASAFYGNGLHLIFTLVLRMGLTASEVCALDIRNILFLENKTVFAFTTRGKFVQERYLVVPKDVEPLLKKYIREMNPTGRLFLNRSGNPLTVHTLDVRVRNVVAKAGFSEQRYTIKDLRARAIYQMLYDGASKEDIQSYVAVTERRLTAFSSSYLATSQMFNCCPADLSRIKVVSV